MARPYSAASRTCSGTVAAEAGHLAVDARGGCDRRGSAANSGSMPRTISPKASCAAAMAAHASGVVAGGGRALVGEQDQDVGLAVGGVAVRQGVGGVVGGGHRVAEGDAGDTVRADQRGGLLGDDPHEADVDPADRLDEGRRQFGRLADDVGPEVLGSRRGRRRDRTGRRSPGRTRGCRRQSRPGPWRPGPRSSARPAGRRTRRSTRRCCRRRTRTACSGWPRGSPRSRRRGTPHRPARGWPEPCRSRGGLPPAARAGRGSR